MRTAPGAPIAGVMTTYRDVTEIRRADLALRASEQRYRQLFENLREDVTVYHVTRDEHGRVANWILVEGNAESRRTFHGAYEAAVGRPITESIGDGMWHDIDRTEAILAGEVIVEDVYFAAHDTHYRSAIFALDENTIVDASLDIGDRVRAEVTVRESEARYRRLAENVADVIWTIDPATWRYTYLSPSITRLRGLTVDEAMSEPLERSLTPESLARVLERNASIGRPGGVGPPDGAQSITDVYDQPCADGSIKHVEVTVTAVVGDDGRIASLLGVSRDVTERVDAERALAQTVTDLTNALASVRTLSGLLPICMYCKKIRNDAGYWDRIEMYISEHSQAEFSHGMCPDCFARYVEPQLDGSG